MPFAFLFRSLTKLIVCKRIMHPIASLSQRELETSHVSAINYHLSTQLSSLSQSRICAQVFNLSASSPTHASLSKNTLAGLDDITFSKRTRNNFIFHQLYLQAQYLSAIKTAVPSPKP